MSQEDGGPTPGSPSLKRQKTAPEQEPYYRIIDGRKYDRRLLKLVQNFADDGCVGYSEAKKLFQEAQDGVGITEIERDTLKYALREYPFSQKATNYIVVLLSVGTHASYYVHIGGRRYDRLLLEDAQMFAVDGQVSLAEAKELWENASDGTGVTPAEKDTLTYAMQTLKFTHRASTFMKQMLNGHGPKSYYKQINGVKYDRLLLEEIETYLSDDGVVTYPEAAKIWEAATDGAARPTDTEGICAQKFR
eukprot:g2716.t1